MWLPDWNPKNCATSAVRIAGLWACISGATAPFHAAQQNAFEMEKTFQMLVCGCYGMAFQEKGACVKCSPLPFKDSLGCESL